MMEKFQQAVAHHQAGRLGDAARAYRTILQGQPDNADALHLLGVVSQQKGEHAQAVKLIKRAIKRNPGSSNYHYNLGLALMDLDKLADAESAFRTALSLTPEYVEAHFCLGTVLQHRKLYEQAIASHQQALKFQPRFVQSHLNMGLAHKELRQFTNAIACFKKALEIEPNRAETHSNMGNTYIEKGEINAAIDCYRQALALQPDNADINLNLGLALKDKGLLGEAIHHFQRVGEESAKFANARVQMAMAYLDQGDLESVQKISRKTLRLGLKNDVHPYLLWLYYSPEVEPAEQLEEAKRWSKLHAVPRSDRFSHHKTDFSPDRRLRIGFVSGDFRRHSVAYFLAPLITHLNREEIEVFCYSSRIFRDDFAERFERLSDFWRDISILSDEDAAKQILADSIDILIDLSGHTKNNRLAMFNRRPAPIQMTYLGFPGTTGLDTMDFRITDHWADPPEPTESDYSESLIRLPGCFLCYEAPEDAPEVPTRQRSATEPVIFGSFNNLAKMSSQTVATWADILKEVPRSRLLLKRYAFHDPETRYKTLAKFAIHGIAEDRLVLKVNDVAQRNHFASYAEMDIALDPFPYNGTATTCEALWMGVPVIVLAGTRHSGRVGKTILKSVGLQSLIADDLDSYKQLAVELAGDARRLSEMKAQLREKLLASPLLDGPAFGRDFGALLRDVWQRRCGE